MSNETEQQSSDQSQTPSWFIDEGIPGVGDRPAWLPAKYKTVADMGRGHIELEKRLGTVPDDYDFSKSRYLDPDYVPFNELKQIAKEKRVPQEVIDKMLESVDKYMDEFNINSDEEIKKLGDNARERVTTLDNWAKANLTKESYEALTNNLRTAEAVKAFEELRGKMMSNTAQVPGNTGNVSSVTSVNDLKIELQSNLEKYNNDAAYRADWTKRLEVAVKSDPTYIDKVGG